MHASVYTCTRLGGDHERNQDRALVGSAVLADTVGVERTAVRSPAVLAVFDGLGGHVAGDVASELAARTIAGAPLPTDEDALADLLQNTDRTLIEAMRAQPARTGMGTTTALLVLPEDGGSVMAANVGDSTIWRLRDGQVDELSVSDRYRGSGVLQCLGANAHGVVPHVRTTDLAAGDRVLIATDGLTDVVPPPMLQAMLEGNARDVADRLLSVVEQAGVPDDLTFLLVDLE